MQNWHGQAKLAMAMAVAVIKPENAYRGRPPRKSTFFYEKHCFKFILITFDPSRPQKWIRLEILHKKIVSGSPEVKI